MDCAPLNDRELLRDTPLGDLAVRDFGGEPGVWLLDHRDRAHRPRVIHIVEERNGVLGALYGKHFWLQARVQKLYDTRIEEHTAALQSEKKDRRRDFRGAFRHFIAKDDARDTLLEGWRLRAARSR